MFETGPQTKSYWQIEWLCFDGTSTIVVYLMPYPVYTYILNIYDFKFGFMAYQPL